MNFAAEGGVNSVRTEVHHDDGSDGRSDVGGRRFAVRGPDPFAERRQARQEARQQAQLQGNHAGQWLRRYKDLPPDQQQKALENDSQFRSLPPVRQQNLAGTLAALQQPSAAAARPHPATHGDLGAPDSRAESSRRGSSIRSSKTCRLSAGKKVRTAIRDLSVMPPGTASAGHRVGSFQERVLAPGARPAQQRFATATGPAESGPTEPAPEE